jgi:hemerythrin-like domain-containing protein
MESSLAILRREHQRILDVAAATEEIVQKIQAKQPVATGAPEAVTELFALYAHLIHRDKEELLLFPLLRNKGFSEGSCIGVLLSEHEENRAAYDEMQKAATEYAGGDAGAAARWAQAAYVYCDRVRYHIRREELAFVNAEQVLAESDHQELVSQFRRLDEKARRAGLEDRIEAAQQLIREVLSA